MSAPVHVPPQVDKLQRAALIAAAVGIVGCAVLGFGNPPQFYRSYLLAFLFWSNVAIGCLSITMIHHLSGGMWGLVIRRVLEAGTRTLRFLPLFFAPVVLGMHDLYLWTHAETVATDPMLQHKSSFLNPGFFLARAAFYFLTWALLAHFLNAGSKALDAGPNRRIERRLSGISGGGLVLMGLTITFAAVDWAMSLDPHWFSTIYGVMFMIGQALSALTFVILMMAALYREKPFAGVVEPSHIHDLGKLMLAFTMLWAYMHLSQFVIIWSGNLPEEIPWYIRRSHGGWQYVAIAVVLFHFVLPFLMLLSRDLKRNVGSLAVIAGLVFGFRFLDLFWLVAPDLADHGHAAGFRFHLLDLAAGLAVGGAWLWLFAREFKDRPLLPIGDPEIHELILEAEAEQARA
jgi:hypothetical protein